jgi:hypothetical protein
MENPSMNRAPRIEYTRADTAQARIARLEAALEVFADGHSWDYTDRYLIARAALKAKP